MEYVLSVIFLLGFFAPLHGQITPIGCPLGWFQNSANCYMFADDKLRVYEEADAYCWSFGATLVSVETYGEHKFISDWLMTNDPPRTTMWYTSGDFTVGKLYWESKNVLQESPSFWISEPQFRAIDTRIKIKVVYTFGATTFIGYGWTNVTSSVPAYAICEIPLRETGRINVLSRNFNYGLGTTEPDKIERGPIVEIQPENIVILEGANNIELDCFASGNPYPEYSWYTGLQHWTATKIQSSERYTLSSGVITISEPEERDVGSYHCRAENKMGNVFSDSAKVIVGNLGHFQNIDPQPVRATAFKGAKMDCGTPSYSPGVTYQWAKNAVTNIFIWPDNPNMFVSFSGSLYISEVQTTDANKKYYCLVTLVPTDGFKMSKAYPPIRANQGLLLLLTEESASDNDYGPIINTHAFPTPALKGHTIRLECIAYGTPPLTYFWYREDGLPFVEGTVLSALNRVLTIFNAPLEAEGNYVCRCVRGSGASATKTLSVFMEAKPYFPYSIKHMLVDPDSDVKWNCKAAARPAATYSWYKDGVLLQNKPGHLIINKGVLQILKVDRERDDGMYQCSATNSHGTTFSTGELKVLSIPPNFKRFPLPEVTLVPDGGNITIPCDVEAAPIPRVTWLKNGGDLNLRPGDTGGRIGMNANYGLVLGPAEFSDQGVYTCSAENDLGTARNTTRLMVIEGIRMSRFPNPQTVLVNRTAFFYCQAAYSQSYDISYIWRFNGRVVDFRMFPEYVSGRSRGIDGLYIMNAQFKNQGIYECEAKTTLHSERASARLIVTGPPLPPAGVYADDQFVGDRSVKLVWTVTAAMSNIGAINGYDVEAESNYKPDIWKTVATDVPEYFAQNEALNSGKREDQRSVTVEDLVPNTSYRFRIRSVNIYGRGQEASKPSTSVKISATEPVLAPRNVGGGGGSVGTLTMTWEPFDISEQCGPGIGYWVYWKREDDAKDWKKSKADDAMALNEGMYVETVGEDNYYMRYIVKVAAYNDFGHGPNSSVVQIFSAEGMPISVPRILDADTINGTAVIINWEPVPDDREHMKGRVLGYRVYYYQDPSGENSAFEDEPDSSKVHIIVKNVYGQQETTTGIGLEPNTDIYVRVQVFNSAGAGPKGEWRWTETFNFPISAYPKHIEVHPHDKHSVKVKWRGVSIQPLEESLLGYIIRVWKIQEDVRTATDYLTDKVQEHVIGGLQKHTVYVLRVLGYSRAGDGAISEAVYFSVLGGSIPFDPTTSEVCYADQESRTCGSGHVYRNILLLVATLIFVFICRH